MMNMKMNKMGKDKMANPAQANVGGAMRGQDRADAMMKKPMMAKGGMTSKKGYAKGGMVKANCGASMKPAQGRGKK